jgi:hypothetical protein
MKMNHLLLFLSLFISLFISSPLSKAQTEWVNINGTVTYNNGTPVSAMVLANGQYMFTPSSDGSFNLEVPLNGQGQIKVYCFCGGLAPWKQLIDPEDGVDMEIELAQDEGGQQLDVSYNIQPINSKWVRLSGTVTYNNGTPVSAMALANGQYMFTSSSDGSYCLDVPLDKNGKITLYGFCGGFPPNKQVITCDGDSAFSCFYELTAEASGTYTYNGGNTLTVQFTISTFPEGEGPPVNVIMQLEDVSVTETTLEFLGDEDEIQTWSRNQGQAGEIVGSWIMSDEDGNDGLILTLEGDGTMILTNYFSTFTVPYGDIIIDGDFTDWGCHHLVYADTDDPECGDAPGLDLQEVYLAQDEIFIYIRFVLNGPLDSTYGYKFGNDEMHTYVYVNGDGSDGIFIANAFGLPTPNIPQDFVHVDGNQFECKFYKSDVEWYWGYGAMLGAWLDQGPETECRDHVDMPLLNFFALDQMIIASGEYFASCYYGDYGPESYFMSLNIDGNGHGTYQDLYSSGGDMESGTFTYFAHNDGRLSINNETHGIISPDWNAFTLTETIGILVAIKSSSGMSNASLNGEYYAANFYGDDGSVSFFNSLNFDGNGNGSYQELYSSEGGLENGTFTYSVQDDGRVTFNGDVHGIISPDENSFIISETEGGRIGIITGIKSSSGMSNADLNGEYLGSSYYNDDAPWSCLWSAAFDGNGNVNIQHLYASDGDLISRTFPYSLDGDGRLTLYIDGREVHGILSTDGTCFTFSDTDDGNIGIAVGIKKTE